MECGSQLKPHGGVNAAIYGFHVGISARHCRARCSKNACRARHWFNYRVRNGEKKYFSEKYREDVLFVTAGVAFDCAFLRYVRELHFLGYVSLAAIAKAEAAVFKAPPTTNFQTMLDDAVFLLHCINEFPTCDYDIDNLVIGGDIPEGALRVYTEHLLQKEFPTA